MKKLIHVVRGLPDRGLAINITTPDGNMLELRSRRHTEVIVTRAVTAEGGNYQRDGEFFLIDATDSEAAQEALARANPGCEVRVYGCESISQSPAGDPIRKKIGESGVLPG